MSSRDLTKNLCDNFYQQACGKWYKHHQSGNYSSVEELVDYQTNLKLIKIVPNMDDELLKMDVFNHTFNYYQSCLKAEGSDPMLKYLEIIKPGQNLEWPILWRLQEGVDGNGWPAEQFDVFAFLGQLVDYGFENILIRLQIEEKFGDTNILLTKPTNNTLDTSTMVDIMEKLTTEQSSSPMSVADGTELALLQNSLNAMYKIYEESPGQQGKILFESKEDFGEFKSGPFAGFYRYIKNIGILDAKKNIKFYVSDVPYFDHIFSRHWTDGEKKDLCNFIMLNLLQYLLKDKGTSGHSELECIKEVRHKLDLPLTFLYYLHVYKATEGKANPDITTIFRQLVDSLTQLLTQFENKSGLPFNAEFKADLKNISINVGNQPRNVHNSHIKRLFAHIPHLQPDNFYINHLQLLRHRMITSIRRFDYRTHVMYSPDISIGYSSIPFYEKYRNMLILPLGLLQPLIYHPNLHDIFKWSTLGFLMARNIFHNYDAGIVYYFPSTSMEPQFYRRCIHRFHNNTKALGVARNIGAAAVAYHAYVQNHPNHLQPDFTTMPWRQLFFLNLAQTFCTSDRQLRKRNSFYLQTIAKRLPSFREAFQCQARDIRTEDMCTFVYDYDFL
ncbi:membrane metallo-endopeptidase-like 1 [Musca autumnalis]|uniref:membrane metallo-endopeptidase-like 1 n=1 Tax=Musca autumnalis TaxID=221902 RepID=UPI003CF3FBA5